MKPFKFEDCPFRTCYRKTVVDIDDKPTECCSKWVKGICTHKMKKVKLKKDSTCHTKSCYLEFESEGTTGCLRWIRGDCEEVPGKRRIIF